MTISEALEALDDIECYVKPYIKHYDLSPYIQKDIETVRTALEALPEPSLKAQALEALDDIECYVKPYIKHYDLSPYIQKDIETVRTALEALPEPTVKDS